MKFILIGAVLAVFAASASAQNAARFRPSFDDPGATVEFEDVVVPAMTRETYEEPYARHVRSPVSLRSEDLGGRTRYELYRNVWGREDGLHAGFSRSWTVDTIGRDSGVSERTGNRFRVACPFPLTSCFKRGD